MSQLPTNRLKSFSTLSLKEKSWSGTSFKVVEKGGFTGRKKDKIGRNICFKNGIHIPCNALGRTGAQDDKGKGKAKPAKTPKEKIAKVDPQQVVDRIKRLIDEPDKTKPEDVVALKDVLMTLTVKQINALKKTIGVKASGRKAELAEKVANRALALRKEKPIEDAKLETKPTDTDDDYIDLIPQEEDKPEEDKHAWIRSLPQIEEEPKEVSATEDVVEGLGDHLSELAEDEGEPSANPKVDQGSRPLLNDDEKLAITKYCGAAFRILNGSLRDGETPPGDFLDIHKNLQSAFSKSKPLENPVVVMRGMNIGGRLGPSKYLEKFKEGLEKGELVELPGYISSTTNTEIDEKNFGGNFAFEIIAKQGLDAGPYTSDKNKYINEFVLNHLSKFKVHSVIGDEDLWKIKLEQVLGGEEKQRNENKPTSVNSLTQEQLDKAEFQRPKGLQGSLLEKFIGKVTVDGQNYFWKGTGKGAAEGQELIADLLGDMGVSTPEIRPAKVPNAPTAEEDGYGSLTEWSEGDVYWEALKNNGGSSKGILEPGEAQRAALVSCLLGIGDRTVNNFMVKDKKLISIDHDMSGWGEYGASQVASTIPSIITAQPLMEEYKTENPKGRDYYSYKLDTNILKEVSDKSGKMVKRLKDSGKHHDADVVERMAKVMGRMADSGNVSVSHLIDGCKEEFKKQVEGDEDVFAVEALED